jgi:hypothetical protein
MIFEDIFYPGNPQRREDIRNYQAALKNGLTTYQGSWNELVGYINPIFQSLDDQAYNKIHFKTLDFDLKVTPISTCLERINSTGENTKAQLEKLFNDIGLPSLPDGKKLQTEKDVAGAINFYISKLPSLIIDTALSVAVSAIVVATIRMLAVLAQLSTVFTFVATTLGSIIFGGVAFIISDMVVSAITGAIERKELNEAIEVYKQADETVTTPLVKASAKMAGVSQCFKDGLFKIDDEHLLMRGKGGKWRVVDL